MGQRTTQRILECGDCGRTPEDGEYMWEMCGKHICSTCIEKDEEPEEDRKCMYCGQDGCECDYTAQVMRGEDVVGLPELDELI